MPIKVPDNLPAKATLENEGVLLIAERVAVRQDVRPLEIALLNLMPEKIKTETQIARLLGATPLQIELSLVTTGSYAPKNTSAEHMLAFYKPWDEVRERKFDGLIITGAPIETLPFHEVAYWRELTEIFDWSQSHVQETFNICWAAQAALQHFHGVPKYELTQKMFGVFPYQVHGGRDGLLRGFNDEIAVPVSRHTEVRREDLPEAAGLSILLDSDEAGLCLIRDQAHRQVYMFNHLEYDTATLADEYHRDVAAGLEIAPPANFFPGDDPARAPINQWRA
ncbi:MAG: homoserine O-succinyltransferase, partial [Rhodospirillaceae bacterium]|nr:homoserine O-succinyltransferase [Rhodospirillaceae bacterium]